MSDSKGISGFDTDSDSAVPKQRRNRLLLFGIDNYEHWDKLQYPVKDCDKLFELLKEHYGFREHDLIHQRFFNEEATFGTIDDELRWLVRKDEDGNPNISQEDNLIIVFSGHGHLDEETGEGYWVPVGAPKVKGSRGLNDLISVSQVVKILNRVQAHHIVLLVDACFSGSFSQMTIETPSGGDHNNPEEKSSRWVLTAGRLETVPDKSEFAEALRHILSENDRPKLSIQSLGTAVKDRVADKGRHTPACISLVEQKYEGGEFFFHRRTAAQRTDQAPRPTAAIAKLPERLRQGSAAHLERLKKGRFKHLNIIQLLLTGNNLPDLIDTQVKSGDTETPLQQAVQSLWGREKPHAVVLGDGGMGKTVSLVRLWEDLLEQSAVPVFVALNEYNAIPESEKHDFVLRSIARNCGLAEALTDDWKNALWELLKTPFSASGGSPSVLLMLDGFNEVTVKKDQLLIDLNRLAEQAKGMQMVITSRYVEIQNFTWAQHSEVIELLPLPSAKIEGYLQQVQLPLPEDEALQKLFGNPMMLTLYAGASSIAKKYEHDKRFRFLPTGSYGELLWNFNEAQLSRHLEDLEHDPDEQAWHCFLLRCLVPRLAYKMELEGQFFVPTRKAMNPAFNFKTLLDEAFTDLNREELTEVFPELDGRRSLLGLGELTDLDAREQRSQKVLKYLVEKLHLLVAEDEALRFVHQNFRDFFAAVHLRNVAEMALVRGELPEEWKYRTFPIYIRHLIGEMEGEKYFDLQGLLMGESLTGFLKENCLSRLLDCSRGRLPVFDLSTFKYSATQKGAYENVGYLVWNILSIYKDLRHTLVSTNLTNLDLREFNFNGIPISAHNGAQYLSCFFNESLVHSRQFIFEGHSSGVFNACYSPNENKILSSSGDYTVKEWSVETGVCLQTFEGHESWVKNCCYSPNGERIISVSGDRTVREWSVKSGMFVQAFIETWNATYLNSACYYHDGKKVLVSSWDKTIKEWCAESGACLRTFRGHKDVVNNACYSCDGKKILSSSSDKTIKEWCAKSGACLRTFRGHTDVVNNACYSCDGKKILSSSLDKTIKEWCAETGACLRTFIGHDSSVNHVCYNSDGKKILSASKDNTVKEWSVISGFCIQTFVGHTDSVNSALYSRNGKKILTSSADGTISEWSVETGLCLQTLRGHSKLVKSACYSSNGKKILSASSDNTIKEWSSNKGICLQIIFGHSSRVNNAFYANDSKKVLSISDDNTIREWSLITGICLRTYYGHQKPVTWCSYSADGMKLLSTSKDNTIKEWIVETGECLRTYKGHASWVKYASYSPNGKKILSASKDGTIKEWSIAFGNCIRTFQNLHKFNLGLEWGGVNSACYSKDGKRIISSYHYGIINEWMVRSCVRKRAYKIIKEGVKNVIYNNDETKAFIVFHDESIKEWDFENDEISDLPSENLFEVHSKFYGKTRLNQGNDVILLTEGDRIIEMPSYMIMLKEEIEVKNCSYFINEIGFFVQGCDFRHLHPASHFTEKEKDRLRRYGAIFSDEDERRWKEAVADAYGDLGGDDEPETPPQP